MKYLVQFGYGCYATFSSMEKAALAMRCIAEADYGVRGADNSTECVIRMEPVFPKMIVPEITNAPTEDPCIK